jgi:hypothetical protein
MLSYALHIATTFLMLLYLAKDWESHKRSWRRITVIILIVLIGVGGCINTYFGNKDTSELKTELEATRKALNSPKASLTFTFARPQADLPLLREVNLRVHNGIVHIEFTVVNLMETPALNGELTLIICDECDFASEPPQFKKLPGQKNTHRNFPFDRILPKTELKTLSADIKVPQSMYGMKIGVTYRCVNCIIPEIEDNTGIVYFSR